MILSLVQSPPTASLFPQNPNKLRSLRPATNPLFRTTSLPRFGSPNLTRSITKKHRPGTTIHASWVGDLYSMAEMFRVSPAGQLLWNAARLLGVVFFIWIGQGFILEISESFGEHYPSDPETSQLLVVWSHIIKGGLDRYYELNPSEGQRAPEVIESFFSEDDHFKDCEIRWRKNFFGEEYICCNNVTVEFCETGYIHIEITPCPLGKKEQYIKAVKLERMLRRSLAASDQELRRIGYHRRINDFFK